MGLLLVLPRVATQRHRSRRPSNKRHKAAPCPRRARWHADPFVGRQVLRAHPWGRRLTVSIIHGSRRLVRATAGRTHNLSKGGRVHRHLTAMEPMALRVTMSDMVT